MTNEVLYQLPEGWIWTTIDDLGIVVSGGTPSTNEPQFWGDNIPWITPADLSGYKEKYISKGRRNISQLGLSYSSATLLPKGSLLFSSRAPIGYIAISQNEIATNQGFKNLIPTKLVSIDYLYYYMLTAKNEAIKRSRGTTFLELSASAFSQIPVPLPPLSTQLNIVSKLEELLSEIEKGMEELRYILEKVKNYRLIILKLAFEGKLSNLIEENDIPKSWKSVKLKDCGQIVSGGTPSTNEMSYWGNEIAWITPADLSRYQYKLISKGRKSITKSGLKNSSAKLMPKGTVLFSSRAPIGYVVIAANELSTNQGFKNIIPDLNLVTSDFLFYFLKFSKRYIEERASGTTFKEISTTKFSEIPIQLPELEEQKIIVNEIEERNSTCDDIEQTIISTLNHSEKLRQSILQKSFEGKLIDQEQNREKETISLEELKAEKALFFKEYNDRKKTEQSFQVKTRKMEELKKIVDILKGSDLPVPSKTLWLSSVHKDNIDAFYAELKIHIDNGSIIELPRNGKESLLKLAQS